jgi:hypothetical protein
MVHQNRYSQATRATGNQLVWVKLFRKHPGLYGHGRTFIQVVGDLIQFGSVKIENR